MAHVYDTDLTKPQRTAIRDALVAKLAPLKKTSVPALYLQAIVTIARPYRGAGDETGLTLLANALLGRAPAIAIALGRTTFESSGSLPSENRGELELALYCCSEHARDVEEGRLYGDAIAAGSNTADPGIWTMLEHARELVAGAQLGIASVGEPRLVEEDEVLTAAEATVWEQRYRVPLTAELDPARSVTQLLLSIEGRHTVEGANPGGPPTLNPLKTLADIPPP